MINNYSSPVQDVDRTTTSGVRSRSPTTAAAWGRGDCQTSPCQAPPCLSLVHLPLTSARLCRRRWVCCARMKSLISRIHFSWFFGRCFFFLNELKCMHRLPLQLCSPSTHTHTHTHALSVWWLEANRLIFPSGSSQQAERVTVRFSQAEQAHRSEGDPSTVRPIYVSDLSGPEQHVVQSVSLID